MINVKALPETSQTTDTVLYFDADARPTELYECATSRMDAARNMLEALSSSMEITDSRALPAVAVAAALLLSDASGMFASLYGVLREHESLIDEASAITARVSARDI